MKNFITTPFVCQDSYKLSHVLFYKDVTGTYATMVPRKSRRAGMDKFVLFGVQAFLINLNEVFNETFFNLTEEEAVGRFDTFHKNYFGTTNEAFNQRLRDLHQLGYLPIMIKSLPEGSTVDHNTPVLTIQSTNEKLFWLAQWLETWLSCEVWKPSTSATTAYYYRKILEKYNNLTSDNKDVMDWSCHDFSMRGMSGLCDAATSGAGHALSFKGSDTCPILDWVNYYYPGDNGLIASSIPASEHSIEQAFLNPHTSDTYECDYNYTQNTLDAFPSGLVAQVCDGYDFWRFIDEILPQFKDQIMVRDGKFIVRPDSSPKTPVEIIIGDPEAPEGSSENKGLVQRLYEIFGGTKNSKGYIDLDSHIGCVYGEAITLIYYDRILEGLMKKGFSSNNLVVGVGSGSYTGYGGGLYEVAPFGPWGISRDSHGIAIKETAVASGFGENQVWRPTYKDPKTDNSGKKSHRGFIKVEMVDGNYVVYDNVSREEELQGALEPVYLNGKILRIQSFAEVRAELAKL